jgi:hypothetical protein
MQVFGFTIMLTNLILLILLANQWSMGISHKKDKELCDFEKETNEGVNFLRGESPWNFFQAYSVFFQFQTFQLLVYQNVGHRKR